MLWRMKVLKGAVHTIDTEKRIELCIEGAEKGDSHEWR